ncbi:hypothetical protein K2173_006439 [Erythroxylum novogranatense]|uniref:Phytochrome kinase substrate 1 n=1 Tax=Erythroxylum novogranatense TaxID=1862640 RepID=A0AAV8U6Q3_9ROSI|nr:hypothetical protein K2173_006439 [Erythroxylum novogranatense]
MPNSTTVMSLPQKLSSENNSENLRDVSFSSYVNPSVETFTRKLAEATIKRSPKDTFQGGHHDLMGTAQEEQEEIGVFSAEKYFKGVMDNDTSPRTNTKAAGRKYQTKRDGAVPFKPQVPAGTPSILSESSGNSQSALLKPVMSHPSGGKTNKVKGKFFLSGLGCRCCSCPDKDFVDVHEHVGEISFKKTPDSSLLQVKEIGIKNTKKNPDFQYEPRSRSWNKEEIHRQFNKLGHGLNKETCFSFPTSITATANLPIKLQQQDQFDLLPRNSIEVFGSTVHDWRSKSFNLERRLTMLSWDGNPRAEQLAYSATPTRLSNENDSDESSDLFEIESLTGKVRPFLARQGSDATPGCVTPTTCYAPSEASIDWSVVTASAADYEELRLPTSATSPAQAFPVSTDVKTKTPKRHPSILLGCKNQDAVTVDGVAHKRNENANLDLQMRQVSDSYFPATGFHAESNMTGFSYAKRQQALSHSIPRSHSPHGSFVHPVIQL